MFKAFDVNCNGAISFRVISLSHRCITTREIHILDHVVTVTVCYTLCKKWPSQDLLVTLSTLLRGSIYEKLRWTFKLYDINGDGCITRGELGEVVTAVHELMGRRHHAEEERKAREQLDRVFKKLDLNQDGVITIEEFIESCLKVRHFLIF